MAMIETSVIRKFLPATTTPSAPRTVRFVASTGAVDRQGDTISPAGWDLDAYRRNPVVLFGHDTAALPIGRARSISVEGGRLVADIEFAPAEVYEFAGTVERLVRAGYLNGISVGFQPIEAEYDPRRKGNNYTRQALMELSIVPVPALAEALVVQRSVSPARRASVAAWARAGGRRHYAGILATEAWLPMGAGALPTRVRLDGLDWSAWRRDGARLVVDHDLLQEVGDVREVSRVTVGDVPGLLCRFTLDSTPAGDHAAEAIARGRLTGLSLAWSPLELAGRVGDRRDTIRARVDDVSLAHQPVNPSCLLLAGEDDR